ncbi:MAG: Unknown protein [uncultured Thiotrichaceae bacterium]|uniref:TauD/TfdA-like domain-containing protein n=1 Tax=uncultured Thiotrichaceae bacterium TaxID=298394 RepID=A0A6S6TFC3_9GAMM|nr:MAG: Unknown protein [uncultured Thiotrichaceae bacterium]
MTDLIPTKINQQHDIDTIRNEILRKGYYLANTGQICDERELTRLIDALGGFWQQGGPQVIAPLPNPTFIAQTTDEIPPHNECAYAAQPPRHLLLHCQENQVQGGDFFLVDSNHVLKTLSSELFALLYYAKFQCRINPSHPETVSLLQRNERGEYHLQYSCIGHTEDWNDHLNYVPLAPLYQGYETIIPSLQAQLRREDLRQTRKWEQGDLLIFDNRRFLHGRNAFQGSGRRLDHLRIH